MPDDVVFVDALPMTATGKISKKDLRAKFADYKLPGGRCAVVLALDLLPRTSSPTQPLHRSSERLNSYPTFSGAYLAESLDFASRCTGFPPSRE